MGSPYTDAHRAEARRLKREEGLSNRKIGDKLGIGRRTIDGWLTDEPAAGEQPPPAEQVVARAEDVGGPSGHPTAGVPPTEPPRRSARTPRKPEGGRVQAPPAGPAQLDFKAIQTYIEGAYKLGGKVAFERGDTLLAAVIDEHATPAARAWVRYIESEPKVAELLRKLMVGTPAGEVIAIHVSIVFSYVLARTAAEQLIAAAQAEASLRGEKP